MIKKYKNLFLYSLSPVIIKIIAFFLLPLYSNELSPKDYATIGLFSGFVDFYTIILILQINTGIMRKYVDFKTKKEKKEFMSNMMVFMFIFPATLILITNIFYYKFYNNIDFLIKNNLNPILFLLITISAYISQINSLVLIYLRLEEKANNVFKMTVISSFLTIFFSIMFILVFQMGILGFYLAQLISVLFTMLYVKKVFFYFGFKYDYIQLKETISLSIPTIPSRISQSLILYSDKYFIALFTNSLVLGIYQFSYNLIFNINIIISAFDQYYYPKYFQIRENRFKVEYSKKIFLLFSFIILLIIIFLTEFMYFINEKYHSGNIYIILFGIYFIYKIIEILANYEIHYLKLFKIMSKASVIVLFFNLLSNFFLIKYFGVIGAIASLTLSQFVLCQLIYALLKKYKVVLISKKFIMLFTIYFMSILSFLYYVEINNFVATERVSIKLSCLILHGLFIVYYLRKKKCLKKEFT